MTFVNGFASAIGSSQSGIVLGSTNADDTNVIGNIQMNPAELAASTDFDREPDQRLHPAQGVAEEQQQERRHDRLGERSPRSGTRSANATPSITKNVNTLRTRSDTVRPMSTADRAIGSDRSRSMRPFWRSSARPTPVNAELNTSVWLKIPGNRNWS